MRFFTALILPLFLSWQRSGAETQCSNENWSQSFKPDHKDVSCSSNSYVAGLQPGWWGMTDVDGAKCCEAGAPLNDCVEQALPEISTLRQQGKSDQWIECPAGRVFKGFSATFHSDTSAASIERALCCKSQGSPDADGQCQDVSLGSTDYKMYTCPDGFFLKGYHVKVPEVWDAEEQPDLEENCIGQNCWDQFRCCQLQSGQVNPTTAPTMAPTTVGTTTAPAVGGDCRDKKSNCAQVIAKKPRLCHTAKFKRKCAKTCRQC